MTGIRAGIFTVMVKMCFACQAVSRMGGTVKDGRAVKILCMC